MQDNAEYYSNGLGEDEMDSKAMARLKKLAKDYGGNGEIAIKLLKIVDDLLQLE